MPEAPRRYLIVVPRPLPAAPLVVRRKYLILVPRPTPAEPLVERRKYLIVVPRPTPSEPRRYLVALAQAAARGAAQVLDRGARP
jgi:hypothetical protein